MNRDLVLFVVDRIDWALGTLAREMADSLSDGHECAILSMDEILNSPRHAWRLSRRARFIYFLGQYVALGFCWLGVNRRCLVLLAHIEKDYVPYIRRLARMGVRQFIGMSEATAKAAREAGIDVRNVWRPGVAVPDAGDPSAGKENGDIRSGTPTVGFSGRETEGYRGRKGTDVFFSAVMEASQKVGLRLRLCGEGWDRLLERFRDAGVEADWFRPRHHAEALEYYRSVDIYLCTSRLEGGPLSVIEAMSAGCAVVSTRVGFVPEVISSGENGVVCEVDDVACLAGSLAALAQDRGKRLEMGRRAAEHVRRHWFWGHDRARLVAAQEAAAAEPPLPFGVQPLRALCVACVRKFRSFRGRPGG